MSGGQYVSTGWNIAGSKYTIEMTVKGNLENLDGSGIGLGTFSQRTETRTLTHNIDDVDKLYINSILQPYIPSLPTGTLVASKIVQIGHPDTVTHHIGDLVVHSVVLTPDEVELAYAMENGVTDNDGNLLIDNDGNYVIQG